MTIFRLRADVVKHRMLAMVRYADNDHTELFKRGESLVSIWRPLAIETITEGDGRFKETPDFGNLGAMPVFSGRAVAVLRPLLEGAGELLPLSSHEGDFYAFNATRVVDALDLQRSELERYSSTGRVRDVLKYEFVRAKLPQSAIFKIPQIRSYLFVSDEFVATASAADLGGFAFIPVWQDHS